MQNIIPRRIYDFLKNLPPFHLIAEEDLLSLAKKVVVQYKKKDEVVFKQGESPSPYFYLVHEGAIHLIDNESPEKTLVDKYDEGDLFGIRPLLATENYALTAVANEESLLYAFRIRDFKEIWVHYPKVTLYLASTFAADARSKSVELDMEVNQVKIDKNTLKETHLIEIQAFNKGKAPVCCSPNTSIKESAKIMSQNEVGSIIIINELNHPLGIVTDKDFRHKVVTGNYDLDEPISTIMSSPVVTALPGLSMADAQIKMIQQKIHHLCLTEDGSPSSKVVGVVSEHDLMVLQGTDPGIIIREIERSTEVSQLIKLRERAENLLENYLKRQVSISFISNIISEINDALIVRSLEISVQKAGPLKFNGKEVSFCWLGLGSEGRKEQLLRTDQDNALVFEDVVEENYETAKAYFLELATQTTQILKECGFDFCPAEMMARNPKWCLSLSEWKKQFSKWIMEPTPQAVLNSAIFFDFRPIYGNENLSNALSRHIFNEMEHQSLFISYLAKSAVERPPLLTFFRNFVVEKSGEHKDEFDIKGRAMMPLADAARVLILNEKMQGINNTIHRFEKLAELDPANKELFEQAIDSYELFMRYRALHGLENQDSGRYFNPMILNKIERLNLRNSFRPIGALQTLIATRFQLAYLR